MWFKGNRKEAQLVSASINVEQRHATTRASTLPAKAVVNIDAHSAMSKKGLPHRNFVGADTRT